MISYLTDPVLRGPTIGCMLMSIVAALVGVILFFRKQSLLGETISHAAYPGIMIGALTSTLFFQAVEDPAYLALCILIGAFGSGILALWAVHLLTKKFRIANDTALCFVLSSFFGIGLTLSSRTQFTHTSLYKQALVYLYGQAATMSDIHIKIYGFLAIVVMALIFLFYKELKTIILDRDYAKSLAIPVFAVESVTYVLIVFAIILGIRSVGVVLMSAMLIAPVVAARQFSHRLSRIFLLASLFGCLSGFLGIILSVELSKAYTNTGLGSFSLPTGPMIVLIAISFALLALLLAPAKGILPRTWRIFRFRSHCHEENILKAIWYYGEKAIVSFTQLKRIESISSFHLVWILRKLTQNGCIIHQKEGYRLSPKGFKKASHIIRLHRLWEVYLVQDLGIDSEKVHHSAEEMEHILTPELEKELTKQLKDPKEDPHQQPIPRVLS